MNEYLKTTLERIGDYIYVYSLVLSIKYVSLIPSLYYSFNIKCKYVLYVCRQCWHFIFAYVHIQIANIFLFLFYL